MLEIAYATGGAARFSNDLSASLLQGVRQGESYYTISYTPQEASWDGRYHRFKLALDRPGAQITYRQGYYARDAEVPPPPTPQEFKAALELEKPRAAGVLFRVNVVPNGDSVEVRYVIDSSTVNFVEGQDGKMLADLDCAILAFDAKGRVQEKSLIRLSETTRPNQSLQPSASELYAKQTIALKQGVAILVIGVRDRATGIFGTLEVSVSGR